MREEAGEFGGIKVTRAPGRQTPGQQEHVVRTTLVVLSLSAMIAASFWVLSPFIPPAVWAVSVVAPTWALMLRVQAALWNSRAAATAVMTLLLLCVFFIPLWLAIATIVEHSDDIIDWAVSLSTMTFPMLPDWVGDLPIVGERIARRWQQAEGRELSELFQRLTPYVGAITRWTVAAFGGLGGVFIQFVLAVILAAVMYARGEIAAAFLVRFARRLAGAQGEQAVYLAGQAIRGVVMGIVVTAFVQSAIGGLGLVLAAVPFASLLTAVMFMLCIAQIGPAPLLLPVSIWMFMSGDTAPAALLLAFCILAIGVDNILRPLLIRRAANLSLLLIFVGVIGGLVAFGLVGLIVGPVVLAVGAKLLDAWVEQGDRGAPQPTAE